MRRERERGKDEGEIRHLVNGKRKGEKEGGRKGGKKGGREERREGRKEGGREGGREAPLSERTSLRLYLAEPTRWRPRQRTPWMMDMEGNGGGRCGGKRRRKDDGCGGGRERRGEGENHKMMGVEGGSQDDGYGGRIIR